MKPFHRWHLISSLVYAKLRWREHLTERHNQTIKRLITSLYRADVS